MKKNSLYYNNNSEYTEPYHQLQLTTNKNKKKLDHI